MLMRTMPLILLACCCAAALRAQTLDRGEIRGTIFDPKQAAVPKAKVTLLSTFTGLRRETRADDSGAYIFPQLAAGAYQVTAEAEGFVPTRVSDVDLHVGASMTIDMTLQLRGQTQAVEVTATVGAVETTTTGISRLINSQSVSNLPLSGRDYRDLAQLSPSAEVVPGLRGGIRLGGQQSDYTGLSIDGGDSTNNFFGEFFGSLETKNFTVPLDAVQEFQVVTNGFAPEFGRSTGGLLNVVTKSGANIVHGSAHYYLRDKSLTANDALGFPSNIDRQQQFGGSFGFPIVKDRQFLFLAVDRQLQHGPLITKFGQDVSGIAVPELGISDLASLEGPHDQHQNLFSGLLHYDWQVAAQHHFGWRAFFTRNDTDGFTGGNGQNETPHAFDNTEHFVNQGVNSIFSLDSVLGANKVNEIKLLISGEKRARNPNGTNPAVNIAGVGVFGQEFFLPGNNDNAKLQAQDNFEYVFNKHDMKFGGDLDVFQDKKDIFAGWSRGEFFFSDLQAFGATAADQAANILSCGQPRCPFEFIQGFGLNNVPLFEAATLKTNYQTGLGFYWQDKWQPNRRLTITYGLRWDGTWNPQPQSPTPGQQVYVGVGPVGFGSHLAKVPQGVPSDFSQFGPRIGLAYNLGSGQHATVIRAAWGLYYAQTPPIFMPTLGGSKTGTLFCFPSPSFPCLPPFPALFPSSLPLSVDQLCSSTLGCPGITYTDPAFTNPRVSNFSAGFERQLSANWSVSGNYVWVHSAHLRTGGFSTTQWARNVVVQSYDQFGRAIVEPFTPADPTIAFGGFGTTELASFSHGNFHQGVLEVERRFSNHFQLFANYTLSSNKDNASSERDTDSFFGPQDPFRIDLDYGRNGLDIRNQFKAASVYSLPHGVVLSGLVQLHSGFAYPAYDVTDANGDAVINQFSNNDRPVVTDGGKPYLLQRYPARQPGFFQTDFRVNKQFRFAEKYQIELLADFFNLFDTENLVSNPDVNGFVADQLPRSPRRGDTSPTGVYGKLDQIAAGSTPFAVQFGVKFEF